MIGKSLKTAWIQSKTLSPNNKTKTPKGSQKVSAKLTLPGIGGTRETVGGQGGPVLLMGVSHILVRED